MRKYILTFFIFIFIGLSLVSCNKKENEIKEEDKIIIESFDYEMNRNKSTVANELSYSLSFDISFSLNHKFDVKDLVVRIDTAKVAMENQETFQLAIDSCNTEDVIISDPYQYPYTQDPYIVFQYEVVDVTTFHANAQVKITSKDIINNIDNFIKIYCYCYSKEIVDEYHLLKDGYFNIAYSDDSLLYYEFDEFSESYTLVSAVNRFYTFEVPATYKGYPVKAIGESAFYGCSQLTSIVIPESVTSIGKSAFFGCSQLTSIVIPESVTSIGDWAFTNCYLLTSIVLPNSITSMGEGTFWNCSSLTSIRIPNGIEDIDEYCFEECNNLLYNEYDNACYLGNDENPYLVLIKAKSKDITSCEIHSNTRVIYNNAFENCSSLNSMVIPNSVISIGKYAFNGSHLASITIPESVTSIGQSAFWSCKMLRNIRIPNSIESIGKEAFAGCGYLTYNEYDNACYLGNEENPYLVLMKAKSKDITTCEIHSNSRFIYEYAFNACNSLINIKLPESVISIGDYAFLECSSFTSIVIPNSITSIGEGSFSKCSNLLSITIPNSVKNIGLFAFSNCSSLKSIIIPEGLTSMDYMFSDCSSLESIVIPVSITTIGDATFDNCKQLKEVYYKGITSLWNSIEIGEIDNDYLITATIYYYSETRPTALGNYWHYVDGVITKW